MPKKVCQFNTRTVSSQYYSRGNTLGGGTHTPLVNSGENLQFFY